MSTAKCKKKIKKFFHVPLPNLISNSQRNKSNNCLGYFKDDTQQEALHKKKASQKGGFHSSQGSSIIPRTPEDVFLVGYQHRAFRLYLSRV
jgi:hypothetical protein|tara:strand:- start:524 stop:796 length:273 start_codon:yes stop_codon:yes gene_type:complete